MYLSPPPTWEAAQGLSAPDTQLGIWRGWIEPQGLVTYMKDEDGKW